jgi:hypothetical protein
MKALKVARVPVGFFGSPLIVTLGRVFAFVEVTATHGPGSSRFRITT